MSPASTEFCRGNARPRRRPGATAPPSRSNAPLNLLGRTSVSDKILLPGFGMGADFDQERTRGQWLMRGVEDFAGDVGGFGEKVDALAQ